MPSHYRRPKFDRELLMSLVQEGLSASEIADRLGAKSVDYVSSLIRKLYPGEYIDRGKIRALYKAGWELWKIADDVHLTVDQVREVLSE